MPPLTGQTFSSTGVDNTEIDAIQNAIKGLGGEFLANLGEKTLSYLIVGRRWSEKYNFCALNSPKTHFIAPQTLLDAQALYKRGESVEVVQYLKKNQVPVFEGLQITVSSLSADREKEVATLVTTNGGSFTRTLNRECDVVIADNCRGKRAKFAQQWEKAVVVPGWIDNSIKRGVALPTKEYLTRNSELGSRYPTDASVEDPVTVPASYSAENNKVSETNSTFRALPAGNTAIDSVDSLQESLIVDFKSGPKRKKNAEFDELFVPKAPKPAGKQLLLRATSEETQAPSSGVLSGNTFSIHGFDARETKILHKTIYSHDGQMGSPGDFLITSSKAPKIPENVGNATVITEWAIERSLYEKRATLADIWGTPVYNQNLDGFKGLKICLSGYRDIELVHMERLVKLLGAELCSSLTVDRDILISQSRQAQKFKYAKVWHIPIVTGEWLWDCAMQGKLIDIGAKHALDGLGARAAPTAQTEVAPAEALDGLEAGQAEQSRSEESADTSAYVEYGSDDDENRTPVGRNFVTKSVPVRRSRRRN